MRTIEVLMRSPSVHWIGCTLLHSVWQAGAVALVLAAMLRRCRRAPAEMRYLAACAALLAMIALPVMTSALLSPLADRAGRLGTIAPRSVLYEAGAVAGGLAIPGSRSPTLTPGPPPSGRPTALLFGLVSVWMAGVLALSVRLMGGWLLLHQVGLPPPHHAPLTGLCDEALARLARALGIRRAVRLLESSLVSVPMVIGGLRPVILLPIAALTGLPPEQLEALLAHELAHIRRHDYLVNLVQNAIEVLLFYHPAAWWAARVIRAEREHCCDDLAVLACGNRLAYARALATMEELRGALPLSLAASGGPLLARVHRILNPEVESMYRLPVVTSGAALLIGSVLLLIAPAPLSISPARATQGDGEPQSRERSSPSRDSLIEPPAVEVEPKLEPNPDVPADNETLDNGLNLSNDQEAERAFVLGDYYQRIGKVTSAAYYFGKIRQRWPKSSWAAKAEGRLKGLGEHTRQTTTSPGPDGRPSPPPDHEMAPRLSPSAPAPTLPTPPGARRVIRILSRDGSPDFSIESIRTDDVSIMVVRGGVQIVCEEDQYGIIDVSADSATIRRPVDAKAAGAVEVGPNGESIEKAEQPMEVFLEGNVLFLQDERKVAGNGEQKTVHWKRHCKRAWYDFRTHRFVGFGD